MAWGEGDSHAVLLWCPTHCSQALPVSPAHCCGVSSTPQYPQRERRCRATEIRRVEAESQGQESHCCWGDPKTPERASDPKRIHPESSDNWT